MTSPTGIAADVRIEPLRHYNFDAERFVAQCKREMERFPRTPITRPDPHPVVMDITTPAFLRRQAG